ARDVAEDLLRGPDTPRRDLFVKDSRAGPAGKAAVQGEDDVPGGDPCEESGQIVEGDRRHVHVRGIGVRRCETVAMGAVPGEGDEDDILGAARRKTRRELLTDRGTCGVVVEEKNRVVFPEGIGEKTVECRGVTGTAREI